MVEERRRVKFLTDVPWSGRMEPNNVI